MESAADRRKSDRWKIDDDAKNILTATVQEQTILATRNGVLRSPLEASALQDQVDGQVLQRCKFTRSKEATQRSIQ